MFFLYICRQYPFLTALIDIFYFSLSGYYLTFNFTLSFAPLQLVAYHLNLFTNGLGVKLFPKIDYFATDFGGSLTPKSFCETQPWYPSEHHCWVDRGILRCDTLLPNNYVQMITSAAPGLWYVNEFLASIKYS